MHFYTLHNQSHAVQLIKNINEFIKSIDYLSIKKIDYYILYISCYLHDISMVIYPKLDKFLSKDWDESDLICSEFIKKFSKDKMMMFDNHSVKNIILETYKRIDELFENEVRSNHEKNSAQYIRQTNDLRFIDESILDIVADISYSHGMDARDVYNLKSFGTTNLVNKKFMMILIRLADLFDMSENRVSITLYNHNKMSMPLTSRFHWISHMITGSYNISNNYRIPKKDKNKSYFEPGSIKETISIIINVKINQLTTIKNEKKCYMVNMDGYKKESKNKQDDDKKRSGNDYIILNILDKSKEEHNKCSQKKCNFLCKWFMKKNGYIINELYYLQDYLRDVQNYFDTEFKIILKLENKDIIGTDDFDDLKNYIETDD